MSTAYPIADRIARLKAIYEGIVYDDRQAAAFKLIAEILAALNDQKEQKR